MKRSIVRALLAGATAVVGTAGLTACFPTEATCEGLKATIVGTANADNITGTSGRDIIAALGGNDTVSALGGDDVVCGDDGNDVILGGAGNDTLQGGAAFDTVSYATIAGPVTANLATGVATGDGTDTLKAVEGVTGTAAADTLTGDAVGNTLTGGGGNDVMAAGGGTDTCAAGGGTDAGQDCELVTGTVDPAANEDTYTIALTAGKRYFLDSHLTCPAPDVRWSMAGPAGAFFSPSTICADREHTPTGSGTGTLTVGGQGGTATGNYSFRLHVPVDATGSVSMGGPAVTAANETPGQNVRLAFAGTAGQRLSARLTNATFPDGYFLNLYRPNGSLLTYGSFGLGNGFKDTLPLDATGTWTAEIEPNGDDVGSVGVRLHTVVDQTGTISVNGPAVAVNTTTPGQNASFTFNGSSGQSITARVTNGTFPDGGYVTLLRPNGTSFRYGSGYTTMTINGAVLDATGTWTVSVDPSGAGTGTASLELDTP